MISLHANNNFAKGLTCQHIFNGVCNRFYSNKGLLINPCLQLALLMQIEQFLPIFWYVCPVCLHSSRSHLIAHDAS